MYNLRIKYFKKPDWFKEEMETKKSTEEVKISYSVVELYKIDGNTDEFFKPNFKFVKLYSTLTYIRSTHEQFSHLDEVTYYNRVK